MKYNTIVGKVIVTVICISWKCNKYLKVADGTNKANGNCLFTSMHCIAIFELYEKIFRRSKIQFQY